MVQVWWWQGGMSSDMGEVVGGWGEVGNGSGWVVVGWDGQ